ncbi:MAG: hypothetical protein KJ728_07235 [Alphaproteobacteria bacterium]|jgi:multisubunit Na+/H+ antiporter MnhC subunit|uniref:hypothetical protein n=1 Tax=Brevundimonas sp. TaxID=1871086 RepID=UPI003564105F|nr:hypothetical protein [Alphaproteobacteria bacterium]MBU1521200.1 hypothetical protein [Alphaproteobacteria bacterium]MBU2029197.1 hypothetical protein [Alphaproteobacteria bacterium]MBU2165925.1 hypothetical protein [Alphaproteobacteria bacterium]MBU2232020.1 hypothetical protein [Alphaproteobacteria bacterium]
MKLSRWIRAGIWILVLAMATQSFWERWSDLRSTQPEASVWMFAGEEALRLVIGVVVLGLGLMLVLAGQEVFDRLTKPHLPKMLPFVVAGLSIAVAATAVLIWVGSAWAPLAVAVAIGLAVYTAKAAGLEPKPKSDNLPRAEG